MKHHDRVTACLLTEAETATALLSLLGEERLVLSGGDHQAILLLSHRKHLLAEQLAQNEQARHRCLEELRLPTDLSALENALTGDAASACQHLKQVAAACVEHNRNNGVLVEDRLRYTLRALEIVTGRTFETPSYGQRGRLGRYSNGRTLATA